MWITVVAASGASAWRTLANAPALLVSSEPSTSELMVNATSSAVSSWPLVKRTPGRRWKIQVRGSGCVQLVASHGCMRKCSSLRTSASKSRPPMRSLMASVPMRGSRLVGELSSAMTMVEGSWRAWRQAVRSKRKARAHIKDKGRARRTRREDHREARRSISS